jgi:hypothetical protein
LREPDYLPGVYPGMFEQSILVDQSGARKTGAFAASLTAQILLGGVLVVVPLIWHEALPLLKPVRLTFAAPQPLREAPQVKQSPVTAPSSPRRFFFPLAPAVSSAPQASTTTIDINAPSIPGFDAAPRPMPALGPAALPQVERPNNLSKLRPLLFRRSRRVPSASAASMPRCWSRKSSRYIRRSRGRRVFPEPCGSPE